MDDSSAIDFLREFAKKTNRSVYSDESRYPISSYRKIERYKSYAVIRDSEENNTVFVWLSDPYYAFGEYSVFSGVFIPVASKYDGSFYVRKRNVLDIFNLSNLLKTFGKNRPGFLSKVVISGKGSEQATELFSGTMAGNKILEALDISPAMRVGLNLPALNFVPELKDQNYIAIINPQDWILDKDSIESLFKLGNELGKFVR
ncbi:MAG: hypothetical protein AB9922_06145 [Bacteroidales bacterium]